MNSKIFFILTLLVYSTLKGFGQEISTEEIMIKNGLIELPGTLTSPTESTNLIIWVHGSGNIDRNGNQAGVNIKANYIQQFREKMNLNGIAVFSYDKRTSNSKNKEHLQEILFEDLVKDAKSVVAYFIKKKQFSTITLVGHSQGSLVAMLASEGVDKYVSLAGPGESIDETIIKQVSLQSPPLGEIAKAHVKQLKETGKIDTLNPFLASLFAKQNQAFLANWFQFKPSEEIKKVNIPILIINGTEDSQIKIEDAKILHKANPKSKLVIIEKMNHVLKTIENPSENMASYYSPDYIIAEQLIKAVTEFINK